MMVRTPPLAAAVLDITNVTLTSLTLTLTLTFEVDARWSHGKSHEMFVVEPHPLLLSVVLPKLSEVCCGDCSASCSNFVEMLQLVVALVVCLPVLVCALTRSNQARQCGNARLMGGGILQRCDDDSRPLCCLEAGGEYGDGAGWW